MPTSGNQWVLTLAKNIFDSHWEPFIAKFSERNTDLEKFLFPYGLLNDPNITKADLFQTLRKTWGEGTDPREIISSMDQFTRSFFVLQAGDHKIEMPERLKKAYLDLHALGAPSSTYSFLLRLEYAVSAGLVAEDEAVETSHMLESFLFRRGVAGFEPTGLHAVFKGLWSEANEDVFSAETCRKIISRRTTVPWPNDKDFVEAIQTGSLYGRRVAKYALREYELSTDGESPIDDFEIEHVLPTKPGSEWDIENNELADALKNTWGNLIPLSTAMNPQLSNSGFEKKRVAFEKSIFSTPRKLAAEHSSWTLEDIQKRSVEISNWAKDRWPYSRA